MPVQRVECWCPFCNGCRYAETVIYRIFYGVNRNGTGRMTLRELNRSDLLEALNMLDDEEDINKVAAHYDASSTAVVLIPASVMARSSPDVAALSLCACRVHKQILKYFSYEHFYVIYCKFWELDTDHDFMIDREDLLRYGNHALTYRIVDRIFEQVSLGLLWPCWCSSGGACKGVGMWQCSPLTWRRCCAQVPRKFVCQVEGKMGYEDFCWFILSEEDKTSDISMEYWFDCVDLDCDGCIRPNEMLVRNTALWRCERVVAW